MLKRQLGTLFLVTCLILTTVPATLGATSTQVVNVAGGGIGDFNFDEKDDHVQTNQVLENEEIGNSTLTNNQTIADETAVVKNVLEQKIESEVSYSEDTTSTDKGQTIVNSTILRDSAEQENKTENGTIVNDQINPGEVYINNTDEGYYDGIDKGYYDDTDEGDYDSTDEGYYDSTDEGYYDGTDEDYYDSADVTETMLQEGFETEVSAGSVVDNRLREASPNTVYKEKSYLDIGDRPGIGKYRELLLFDLSEYTDAENISSATLSLNWFYPDGKERPKDTIIEVYRPAAAWNPENVTWNSRDIDILWSQPGGDWFDRNKVSQGDAPYATITLKAEDLPDNRYYELDVTELVKEYVSGRYENTGFLIKTRTETADYVAFYSSNTENEEQHPKLNIEDA